MLKQPRLAQTNIHLPGTGERTNAVGIYHNSVNRSRNEIEAAENGTLFSRRF